MLVDLLKWTVFDMLDIFNYFTLSVEFVILSKIMFTMWYDQNFLLERLLFSERHLWQDWGDKIGIETRHVLKGNEMENIDWGCLERRAGTVI